MNANEMTFGVEFEVTIPSAIEIQVGGYHRGLPVAALPVGWNAQSDASIHATVAGHRGVEIVSPVLKGEDGLRQIVAVCKWLKSVGARVNGSTGMHVHVGFHGQSPKRVAMLVGLMAFHEMAFYAVTGTKARETANYSRPIKSSSAHKVIADQRGGGINGTSRYHSLNVTNLTNVRAKTVEFRTFAGTTNQLKAVGYVRMCLALVERCLLMQRQPRWDAKKPVESAYFGRMGEGKGAFLKFCYYVGWLKGNYPTPLGNVAGAGVPGMDTTRRQLLKMAEKYDTVPRV